MKQLYVVSHTHWDREWYEGFQEYRARQVRMIDDLLDILENDSAYAYFHFDGQTVFIKDYLEIRPQNKERLYGMIRQGRILIGPWYTMPDSFLVSGESLIRNLKKGFDICKEIGVESMKSGYMPDLFGHNSQFPQILQGFQIDNAVFFRGVADYPKELFQWQAPDGSEVMVHRLDRERAYSNFYFAVRWPFEGRDYELDERVDRIKKLLAYIEKEAVCDHLLLMDGVDHIDADPVVPRLIEDFNKSIEGVTFQHARLTDYFDAVKKVAPKLETLSGNLYQIGNTGMNNLVLKNVLSSQVYIKQQNDAAERVLTRLVEPFDAFLTQQQQNGTLAPYNSEIKGRGDFIATAWDYIIQNHPHDSICGCSITDVHQDNEYRFHQADLICKTLIKNMGETLANSLNITGPGKDGAVLILNRGQKPVNGPVEVELFIPTANQDKIDFYDESGRLLQVQVLDREMVLNHQYKLRELIRFEPIIKLRAIVNLEIPAFGYTTVTYDNNLSDGLNPGEYRIKKTVNPKRLSGSMQVAPRAFDTGKILVEFTPQGSLNVTDRESGKEYFDLNTFESGGDIGDGYNYVSPKFDSKYLSSNAEFAVESNGPLAAVIRVTTRMLLPEALAPTYDRRGSTVKEQVITSFVTLTKDSRKIAFRTEIENCCLNQRTRVLFPTGIMSDSYYTKTPFAMSEWSVGFENWENRAETETFVRPSQGITLIKDDNAAAIYARGLYEVEVSRDPSRTVALTLFRSTAAEVGGTSGASGLIERKMVYEYCIELDDALTPVTACISGEDWRNGVHSCPARLGEGSLPTKASFIELSGDGIVLSSYSKQLLKNKNGQQVEGYVIRVFEGAGNKTAGSVRLPVEIKEAFCVDNTNAYLSDLSFVGNQVDFELNPCRIASIAVVCQ